MTISADRKRRTGSVISTVAAALVLLLSFLCFFAACWYVRVYGKLGFDSILFTLGAGLSGADTGLILNFIGGAAIPAVACTAAICLLLFIRWKPVRLRGRLLLPFRRSVALLVSLALSIGLLVDAAFRSQLVDYLLSALRETELYETEYRDPRQVQITFPEEKRNLIYIYLESMETSYMDTASGGALEYNVIPELTQLAQSNLNFSHNDGVGGFLDASGTSWTVGAMVAQTSGVPLKVPEGISDQANGYGKDGNFLPGLCTLSDLLHEQGYYQAVMFGSDANFGGRKTYFQTHGVDRIYDLYSARSDGTVSPNYWNNWWGFEDEILFSYAQTVLTELAAQEQPFSFTMLTVDTHHIGGYTCELCGSEYEESYENAIACSSRQVAQFVSWLQQQDFYENTTVIITGDHYSMDNSYFTRNVSDDYTRHVYNCFLNAAAVPMQAKNRQFCAIDMFPTTLAAMGCTIEGDRLGLGTNLFSALPTLIERMGHSALNDELSKRAAYYELNFYATDDISSARS